MAVALAFFAVIGIFGFMLIDTWGMALFNVVFGNEVYTALITYHTTPTTDLSGKLTSIYFDWNLSLGRAKVPIETVLGNYKIDSYPVGGTDLSGVAVSLYTVVYVANRLRLYERTFTLDANPKQITIYLNRLDPSYGVAHVEVSGYYQLGDTQVPLSVGGAFPVAA